MKQVIKEKRRKGLQHTNKCPMRLNIYSRCICHYDDCLNYDERKREGCICDILEAKEKLTMHLIWKTTLPKWKKVILWLRKPYLTWGSFYRTDLPKKIWY